MRNTIPTDMIILTDKHGEALVGLVVFDNRLNTNGTIEKAIEQAIAREGLEVASDCEVPVTIQFVEE